jgi:hypothetical protein
MHDLIHNALFIQLLGFSAIVFNIAIFQVNDRIKMLVLKVCGALIFVAHFSLLGAATGAAMVFIGVARDATYILTAKKRNVLIPVFFIAIFAAATLLTWQGPISLLALAGMVFGTLAFWQVKPRRIRRFALAASSPWVIYDLISGSYPGMVLEGIAIASNLLGIYRFDSSKLAKTRLKRVG